METSELTHQKKHEIWNFYQNAKKDMLVTNAFWYTHQSFKLFSHDQIRQALKDVREEICLQVVGNDGGRKAAGFKAEQVGDCVCRSICIATGLPYMQVYDRLAQGNFSQRKTRKSKKGKNVGKLSAQDGINVKRKWFNDYMTELGFVWHPLMKVGQGCKNHLRKGEIPMQGRLVVNVSKHFTAVIDGEIHDTYDCSRDGQRCVYGYFELVLK